jgi:CheY-like chemotaxis protein
MRTDLRKTGAKPRVEPRENDVSHFAKARILVVDDEPEVLETYQHVFQCIVAAPADALAVLAADLFDVPTPTPSSKMTISAVDMCRQGEDAVRHVENKEADGIHYPVAFIDMRMPPGIDGLETAKRLRRLSPDINIVVVTGYSDYAPQQIALEVGSTDRLFYLVKPFNPDELLQLTVTLVNRWQSERRLAQDLVTKICELEVANAAFNESRDQAQRLSMEVNQLVERLRALTMKTEPHDQPVEQQALAVPVSLEESSHADCQLSPELQAAFDQGYAAASRFDGLGLCPYGAIKETALFRAWIAGYQSANK